MGVKHRNNYFLVFFVGVLLFPFLEIVAEKRLHKPELTDISQQCDSLYSPRWFWGYVVRNIRRIEFV